MINHATDLQTILVSEARKRGGGANGGLHHGKVVSVEGVEGDIEGHPEGPRW